MPATVSSARERLRLLLALVLAAAGLAAVTSAAPSYAGVAATAEGAARDAAHRWAGYRIPRNGHADGGWIGGYRVGKATLYVTTPRKRPNRRGYESTHAVEDFRGRSASRRETVRAAWILSKYGGYRDAIQAAAVDASVYHLLAGRRWRITRARGARRIRQAGDSASVRRFAMIMLRQSRRSAGAYEATVTATGADVGGTVAASVIVTDGRGHPVSGLPVTLAMSGAGAVDAVTGDNGRAVARFAAGARGWRDVTATVTQVPEHRLLVRSPVRRRQATAAEAGVRRTLVASTRAAVRGPQTLALKPSVQVLNGGGPAVVTATVTGDGAPRTATASLHGPLPAESAADCGGAKVGEVSTTVSGDGSYQLPAVTTTAGGYYAWRVSVDGTATSHPVSGCGATIKVRSTTTTSVLAGAYDDGQVIATGTVSGLTFGDQVTMTATLSGPYDSALLAAQDGCNTTIGEPAERIRNGNGSRGFSVGVGVAASGDYYWQVRTSAGDLWLGSGSQCGAPGTRVYVPPSGD